MSDVFIGRYKVIEELGRGGMGIVYRGEDPALDRPVAIKVLPPKKLSQQKAIKRFLREARLCARLDHPNIIKIHDIGEEEGIYHIVMELVEGRTLREIIEERNSIGEIDIDAMVKIFRQVCEALVYAHGKKIIHRDIKPDNIKITPDNRVKVMDFGLAVLEDRHSLTEMGQVMGTVAYFSPEQARGDPADHRSDIYSLGAVFFEMLTNQLVFQATNPGEMIAKHLTSPPPNPKIYNPAISPLFTNMILRTLKKNPAERIQSVSEIIDIIDDWIDSQKIARKDNQLVSGRLPSPPGQRSKVEEQQKPYKQETLDKMASAFESGFVPESIDEGFAPKIEEPLKKDIDQQKTAADYRDVPSGGSFERPRGEPPVKRVKKGREITRIPVKPEEQKPPQKEREVKPTSGESPVASTKWMKEAQDEKQWDRYQYVLDKIKKDKAAREQAGVAPVPVICPRCGAENSSNRKYCLECGNLISHSQFLAQKKALAHNEKGNELMRENKLEEAAKEFELAVENDPNLLEAHMSLGKVLGDLGEYKKARACYRKASELMPQSYQPHVLIGDLYRLEDRRNDAIYEYREASKLAPTNIEIRNQLALLYSQSGDIDRAIDEYQRILSVDSDNLEAHRQLGYMYMAKERYNDAIREFEWVLDVDPGDEQVNNVLGNLYIKIGRLNRAEEVYHTVLSSNPDSPEAIAALGEIYEKQNRLDLALDHFSQAIQKDQANVEVRKKLADLYSRHNRQDLALRELQEASKFRPDDPELHRELGDIYLKSNQLDKALLHFEKTVNLAPGTAELHHKLAKLYTQKDYSELSLNEYKKAVNLEPYNPTYREDLGMAYYAQNRYDEAISEMRKAATLDSTNIDYHKALGIMYEESEQLELAEKQFQKVIQMNPRDAMAQGMLGRVYAKQGLLSMAIYQYQKALKLNPDSHLFHVYLGKALSQQGRMGEAVQAFKRAIELAPGGADARGSRIMGKAYADLGRVYLEQGELRKAMDVLKSAEENNPNDPVTMHYLGLLYTDQKKLDKARDYLTRALKLDPQNAEIMRDLAYVYREIGNPTLSLSLVRKSISLDPGVTESYEILANTLNQMGRYTEAQQALDDGIQNCPAEVDYFHWLKGTLAAEAEKWEEATEHFTRTVELNDTEWSYHKDLARALEEMDNLNGAIQSLNNALSCQPEEAIVKKIRRDLNRLRKKRKRKSGFLGKA